MNHWGTGAGRRSGGAAPTGWVGLSRGVADRLMGRASSIGPVSRGDRSGRPPPQAYGSSGCTVPDRANIVRRSGAAKGNRSGIGTAALTASGRPDETVESSGRPFVWPMKKSSSAPHGGIIGVGHSGCYVRFSFFCRCPRPGRCRRGGAGEFRADPLAGAGARSVFGLGQRCTGRLGRTGRAGYRVGSGTAGPSGTGWCRTATGAGVARRAVGSRRHTSGARAGPRARGARTRGSRAGAGTGGSGTRTAAGR